jgi:sortase A
MASISLKTVYRRLTTDSVLGKINAGLLALIIVINGYVVVAPMVPRLDYEVKQHITKPVKAIDPQKPDIDRSKNHLVIPELQLDQPIFDGTSPSTVHKGIWRRPNTSTPGQGSNTVLVGHRFTYAGAAVFYSLDKLGANDDVYVAYNQKIYHYRVEESKIVPPTAVEVEAPTNDSVLTLYTCTPLWTAKDRLIYVAKLLEVF